MANIRPGAARRCFVLAAAALVEVVLPAGASASALKVHVDGRDVSSAFAVRADGQVTGLVIGLANGNNVLSASADGATAAKLLVTNAPRGGPVYSGAQVVRWTSPTGRVS